MYGIVVPVWKRFRVTSFHMVALAEVVRKAESSLSKPIRIFYVTSPEDGVDWDSLVDAVDRDGLIWTVSHPNQPLADKVNHGIKQAMQAGADQVMYVNSDDFLTVDYLVRSFEENQEDPYRMADGVWFADSDMCCAFRADVKSMGAFATFRKPLLEATYGNVMWTGRSRGIDAKPIEWFAKHGITGHPERIHVADSPDEDAPLIVDWKSSVNMGSYARMWSAFGPQKAGVKDPEYMANYLLIAEALFKRTGVDIRNPFV